MTDMSMISALIDELNKSADEWNSSNMFELARMCREAADTIWQLRDDLQRTNDAEHDESRAWDRVRKAEAEADRLREERDTYRDLVDHMVHPDIPDQLAAENAKLRKLVAKMARALGVNSEWCDRDCEREFGCGCEPCPLDQALRELGVEVDG